MLPKPSNTAPSTAPTGSSRNGDVPLVYLLFCSSGGLAMPRQPRIVIPGLPHHITQRGNRRMDVFIDAEDRQVFLRMLRENSERYSLRTYSYCLMTNHVHLISIPEQVSSLMFTMRDLLGPYASYLNRKHGLSGRLWQGRFFPLFWMMSTSGLRCAMWNLILYGQE
jgi:REP element-mobilizing transposase RayT